MALSGSLVSPVEGQPSLLLTGNQRYDAATIKWGGGLDQNRFVVKAGSIGLLVRAGCGVGYGGRTEASVEISTARQASDGLWISEEQVLRAAFSFHFVVNRRALELSSNLTALVTILGDRGAELGHLWGPSPEPQGVFNDLHVGSPETYDRINAEIKADPEVMPTHYSIGVRNSNNTFAHSGDRICVGIENHSPTGAIEIIDAPAVR